MEEKTRLKYPSSLGPTDRYRDGDGLTIWVKHKNEQYSPRPILLFLVYKPHISNKRDA